MSRRSKIERHLLKEQCIGRGTFSAVFQVQNVKNKQKFALKRVFIGNIEDKKAKNDCINEVYLLQVCSNNFIILMSSANYLMKITYLDSVWNTRI